MACSSCAKGYSLLRQERGCPGCGFSFCSKCLSNKVYLPKLKTEAKVCAKCKKLSETQEQNNKVIPPDAYYKRLAAAEQKLSDKPTTSTLNTVVQSIDDEIQERLKKLKENNATKTATEEDIAKRLKTIKGEVPSASEAEIHSRLAKLKGMPTFDTSSKPALPAKDLRTEQEQIDDLMKQYLEQTQIDSKYQDGFDNLIRDMESRVQKLKGATSTGVLPPEETKSKVSTQIDESEDEEESVRKIVEKIKSETSITDDEISVTVNDELPFCEICNEDAKMRCLGCRYLFCKQCFLDHKDDDDGCDKHEPYQPPKGSQY